MNTITLQEPFRALFYTPFYAAITRGDFAAAGVDVTLITVGEPDRAVANLLSGAAHMAWSGPMRVIRDHAANPDSPLVSFGAVVMKDPFLLVGRGPKPGFTLRDLRTHSLGVVSEVPTPWWCLQRDLLEAGIDPAGLETVQGRTMAENADAVAAGTLGLAQVFEPFATMAEAKGCAVWHAQADRGPTSYTAFYATRAILAERRPAILGMIRGLASMQRWLQGSDAATIAATVAPFFAGMDRATLEGGIARYRKLGLWAPTPFFPRDAYESLEASMLRAGAIPAAPGYDACIDNAVVQEALG